MRRYHTSNACACHLSMTGPRFVLVQERVHPLESGNESGGFGVLTSNTLIAIHDDV